MWLVSAPGASPHSDEIVSIHQTKKNNEDVVVFGEYFF